MPAILAGAGILAVVALLVFWPSGDGGADKDGGRSASKAGDSAGSARAGAKGGKNGAAGGGGVAPRSADDPSKLAAGQVGGRRNPAVPRLEGMGMAPGVPAEELPPKFKSVDEEITWYEGKLDSANTLLATRQKAVDRLPKAKERAAEGDNAEDQLARLAAREGTIKKNLETAQAKVDEIEAKLAELRGE